MARGGGGRSGGGGSRGGGGFSSSSSRSSRGFSSSSGGRSSFSSGSRSSYSSGNRGGSSFGGSRPGGFNTMGGGPRPGGPTPSMGGGYRPGNSRPPMGGPIFVSTPRRGRRTSGGGGCASSLVTMIVLFIFLMILFSMFTGGNRKNNYSDVQGKTEITSTVEREALPSGSVNETGYYTDNLGVINLSTTLTSGMKTFYKETGVQPYLYLASEKEVSDYGSLQNLADAMYDELFTDEAHFLFAYTEDAVYDEWEIWFVTGTQATAVIDTEAEEIIYQYFVRYYNDTSLSYEEFFSKMFEESGELMMKKITNGYDVAKVAIMIVGGVAVIGIVVYGINKSKKIKLEREKEQNEFTEKMMNVPLETFSEAETDKELEELMKKYKESESK